MQHRMKEFSMTEEAIGKLLLRGQLAHIGTINEDGSAYVLPVNYLYDEGKLYIHGLKAGTKLENIRRDNRVCLEVCEFNRVMKEHLETPCSIDVDYESVVVTGRAYEIEAMDRKSEVFARFFAKYAPECKDAVCSEARIRGTLLLEIIPEKVTGKYHN